MEAASPELAVPLRSGPLTAVLQQGTLRDLRVAGLPALDAVYVAVRDHNWGTVPGVLSDYQVTHAPDGFRVGFTCRHTTDELDYRWQGTIDGRDGTVVCTMEGTAEHDFRANRIGFCLLHPQTLKGRPVVARTTGGVVLGEFPRSIAPHQPFLELTGMAYDLADGVRLDVGFEGELFETEDHRNWTDPGWKTYCTPLRLGFPHRFAAGQGVRQVVTIRAEVSGGARQASSRRGLTQVVTVQDTGAGRLPALGLGASTHDGPLDDAEVALVRQLRPAHLHIELRGSGWAARLERAAREAQAVGALLDIGLVEPEDVESIADGLARLAGRLGRVFTFDATTHTTPSGMAASVRAALRARGVPAAVGGGSRAFFAELSRARLPLEELDCLTYGISPQVHHFDDASVMATLPAQADTLADAQRIAAGRPVVVGPITLRMRFNPVATGEEPEPAPGALPSDVDRRQVEPFTAAWTVGTIAALSRADALTCFETAGWRGLLARREPLEPPRPQARPGTPFPVWHVFHTLAGRGGQELLAVEADPQDLGVVAVRANGEVVVLVANLVDRPRVLRVQLKGAHAVAAAPLEGGGDPLDPERLELAPYNVAVVRGVHQGTAREPA